MVYIPGTMSTLASLMSSQQVGSWYTSGYAATEGDRESQRLYGIEVDQGALNQAAFDSLRQLPRPPTLELEPCRRVVIAAEVPDDAVTRRPPSMTDPSYSERQVTVQYPVRLSQVTAVYVDLPDAEAEVATAADAIGDYYLESGLALAKVGVVQSRKLRRHAIQEIPDLLHDQ